MVISTRQITKQEFKEIIDTVFADYNENQTVAVMTESESDVTDKHQSIMLVETI